APVIWASRFGESVVSSQVLDRLIDEGPEQVSPLAFQGSVYNAAIARLSIALGWTGPTETVSDGDNTLAAALEQGRLWAQQPEGAQGVLVLVGDEAGWAVQRAHGEQVVRDEARAFWVVDRF